VASQAGQSHGWRQARASGLADCRCRRVHFHTPAAYARWLTRPGEDRRQLEHFPKHVACRASWPASAGGRGQCVVCCRALGYASAAGCAGTPGALAAREPVRSTSNAVQHEASSRNGGAHRGAHGRARGARAFWPESLPIWSVGPLVWRCGPRAHAPGLGSCAAVPPDARTGAPLTPRLYADSSSSTARAVDRAVGGVGGSAPAHVLTQPVHVFTQLRT
jgi:hypothetical protein